MQILPAIDLKDRKVVRLYKGDFDTVHQSGSTSSQKQRLGDLDPPGHVGVVRRRYLYVVVS